MASHGSSRNRLSLGLPATMADSVGQKMLSTRNDVAVSAFQALHLRGRIEVEVLGHCLGSRPTAFSLRPLIALRCELAWVRVGQREAHRHRFVDCI